MPPKIVSKMFRKGKTKGKAKNKQKQVVNVKINIDQSKRSKTVPREPSATIAKKGGASFRTLPAFSAAPQGFAGGGVQSPAVVVQPMPQPVQQPDTTTQALTAYNNLLLQSQAQQNAWRSMGGLNIQPSFGGLRQSSQEQNLFNPNQVPYDYYRSSAGVVEEVVDDLTYDDPRTNEIIDNRLEYAPQLPDLTESASTAGLALQEKQDNALSNLVSREKLNAKDKQVQNDLNNINEEQSVNDVLSEIDKAIAPSSSSSDKPKQPSKKQIEKLAELDKPFFEQVKQEVANLPNSAGKWFTTAKGTKLMYITEIPEGRVYNLASGRWISNKSPIYLNAVKTGNGDLFTTNLGEIHRVRKLG